MISAKFIRLLQYLVYLERIMATKESKRALRSLLVGTRTMLNSKDNVCVHFITTD